MGLLSSNEKMNSITAVKAATNNNDPFHAYCNVDVLENGHLVWSYNNISVSIYYDVPYMQFIVNIVWEDDTSQSQEYKARGLHGMYNTNFQHMEYRAKTLIVISDSLTIHIKL